MNQCRRYHGLAKLMHFSFFVMALFLSGLLKHSRNSGNALRTRQKAPALVCVVCGMVYACERPIEACKGLSAPRLPLFILVRVANAANIFGAAHFASFPACLI
jgi:hypothetical protein